MQVALSPRFLVCGWTHSAVFRGGEALGRFCLPSKNLLSPACGVCCIRRLLSPSSLACRLGAGTGCRGGRKKPASLSRTHSCVSAHGNLSHVKWCDCCGALDLLWFEAQRCSLAAFPQRRCRNGQRNVFPPRLRGITRVPMLPLASSLKRLRPSGRCVRAAKWRSICGDWPVLRGRLAQLTHTQ